MANMPFSGVLYRQSYTFHRIRLVACSPDIVFGAGHSTPARHAQRRRARSDVRPEAIRAFNSTGWETDKARSMPEPLSPLHDKRRADRSPHMVGLIPTI